MLVFLFSLITIRLIGTTDCITTTTDVSVWLRTAEQFVHLFVVVLCLTETFHLTNEQVYFVKSIRIEDKTQPSKKKL